MRKAGISFPTLLLDICVAAGMGGVIPDIAGGAGGGVLSTFYVLIVLLQI